MVGESVTRFEARTRNLGIFYNLVSVMTSTATRDISENAVSQKKVTINKKQHRYFTHFQVMYILTGRASIQHCAPISTSIQRQKRYTDQSIHEGVASNALFDIRDGTMNKLIAFPRKRWLQVVLTPDKNKRMKNIVHWF